MSVKVKKGNEVMAVRDEHQLAAFLNNGWELASKETKATKAKAEEAADVEEPAAPKKPATRRKATTRKAR